jgi:hypothetical protein
MKVAVAVLVEGEVRGMVEGMRVVGGVKEGMSEGRRSSAGSAEEGGASLVRAGCWDLLSIGRSEGTSKIIGRRGFGAVLCIAFQMTPRDFTLR